MFGKYVAVLKTPGALRFSIAGFMGRAQMSMIGLGAVLLLQSERGSYAIAGAVSAIYALSMAAISPQASRLVDIFGQRRILRIQLALHVPLMSVLIVLAMTDVPNWVLYVLAFFTGGVQPNIGALVRARWSAKLSGSGSLRTAFAWESMLDEVIFVAGPPLATFLVIAVFPSAAMIVATAILAVGTWWFSSLRASEPKPVRRMPNQARQRPATVRPVLAHRVVLDDHLRVPQPVGVDPVVALRVRGHLLLARLRERDRLLHDRRLRRGRRQRESGDQTQHPVPI